MKQYSFKINGKSYDVEVKSVDGGIARVDVNGVSYEVEADSASRSVPGSAVSRPASSVSVAAYPATAAPSTVLCSSGTVKSPLPGVILDIRVAKGDKVYAGQTVAVLEAMKMENDIEAEIEGVVTAVHVTRGDSVLEGAPIVTIA